MLSQASPGDENEKASLDLCSRPAVRAWVLLHRGGTDAQFSLRLATLVSSTVVSWEGFITLATHSTTTLGGLCPTRSGSAARNPPPPEVGRLSVGALFSVITWASRSFESRLQWRYVILGRRRNHPVGAVLSIRRKWLVQMSNRTTSCRGALAAHFGYVASS